MTSAWKPVQLGELVDIRHGFAFKGEYIQDEETADFLLTPGNFAIGGGFQWGKRKYYSGPVPAGYILQPGDIIVTMTDLSKEADTLGYAAKVPEATKRLLHNQRLGKLIFLSAELLPDYSHWLLRSNDYRNEILANYTGSTVKHTSPKKIKQFRFLLPPLWEQREIAATLGALDDKIELNRRTCATLEAMARALFRSWFVDFDPVHAKAAGEAPAHMDPATAALFPDGFGEDGLPKGWRSRPIGQAADIVGGSTPSTKKAEFWDGGTHLWATPRDLSRLQTPILLDTERRITDAGVAQISSRQLPPGTLLLSSRAPIGYLAIAQKPVSVNQGFIALRETADLPSSYTLFWCHENMEIIVANANGSTFQEISKRNFRPLPVVVPSRAVMVAYQRTVDPIIAKVAANEIENAGLSTLRDALLPKLMSGELRVREAERQVAEVA